MAMLDVIERGIAFRRGYKPTRNNSYMLLQCLFALAAFLKKCGKSSSARGVNCRNERIMGLILLGCSAV